MTNDEIIKFLVEKRKEAELELQNQEKGIKDYGCSLEFLKGFVFGINEVDMELFEIMENEK